MVILSEHRTDPPDLRVSPVQQRRKRGIWMPARNGMIDFLEKSGRCERRVFEQIRGREYRRCRNAALLQVARDVVAIAPGRPFGNALVQHFAMFAARERRCKSLIHGPRRSAHSLSQRAPLRLRLYTDRYPAILAAGRKCAVRSSR